MGDPDVFPGILATARRGLDLEIDGRTLRAFCGSDYLGFARDPRVIEAAQQALATYGVSPSASRWTSGETTPHRACEEEAARFFGTEDAVLLPVGYLAGQAVVEVLPGVERWYQHENAHAALDQARRQVGAELRSWNRSDQLGAQLDERAGVLSDAIFAFSGRRLDLAALVSETRPAGARVVIDEAHSFGVIGPGGRGLCAASGVGEQEGVYAVGTLSKAFGAFGGVIPASAALAREIRSRLALYVGATPIPAALATAATTALRLAREEPHHLDGLRARHLQLRAGLKSLELACPDEGVPIFALHRGLDVSRAHDELRAAGFFVPVSRYPGSPPGGALAVTLCARHTGDEVDRLLEVLAACRTGASTEPPRA